MNADTSTVLIVEDEAPLREALKAAFEAQTDYQVLVARNGKQGLETAQEKHPDLILLDIVMPGMDGIDMLKQLRKDPWGEHADVILLTNVSDTERVAEALSVGTYEYLVKSDYTTNEIVEKVKGHFKEREQ